MFSSLESFHGNSLPFSNTSLFLGTKDLSLFREYCLDRTNLGGFATLEAISFVPVISLLNITWRLPLLYRTPLSQVLYFIKVLCQSSLITYVISSCGCKLASTVVESLITFTHCTPITCIFHILL